MTDRTWRDLWAYATTVQGIALAAVAVALLTGHLDYNPNTGPGMGLLGLLLVVSAASCSHFHGKTKGGRP